jgi:hypothetical protein
MRGLIAVLLASLIAFPAKADQPNMAVVEKGATAPFSGILVTSQRMQSYLELQLKYEECLNIKDDCQKKLEIAPPLTCQPGWWEQHSFKFGIGVGVVAAVLLAVGTASAASLVRK